jgi:hypothetical protein
MSAMEILSKSFRAHDSIRFDLCVAIVSFFSAPVFTIKVHNE